MELWIIRFRLLFLKPPPWNRGGQLMCECLFHLVDKTNHRHDGGCPLLRCVCFANKVATHQGTSFRLWKIKFSWDWQKEECSIWWLVHELPWVSRQADAWWSSVLPDMGTRVKVVFGSVVSRVADDPTNSNNECSISQVKIKHELCNTTLSCLPFAAWSFGPLCVMSDHHVNYVSRIMFMKFHEGITTSDILRVQWNYPKLWAKSKVRDPTTKPLRNWWQNPWKFPWGSTAPARHENFRIFLRGENPGEFLPSMRQHKVTGMGGFLENIWNNIWERNGKTSREWSGK